MSWGSVEKTLLATALIALGTSALSARAYAKISDDVCSQIRAQSQKENTRWFSLAATGKLTPLHSDGALPEDALGKVVYLHSRDDGNTNPTIMAAKLIYSTHDDYLDRDWVRAQNNFKRRPVSVKYSDYNAYENGSKESFTLRANFHLTKGGSIPFSTYTDERRQELILPPNGAQEERTYRVYLQNFEGISQHGSCMDFSPNVPTGTWQTSVEVIDLLPSDGDVFYRDKITFKVLK